MLQFSWKSVILISIFMLSVSIIAHGVLVQNTTKDAVLGSAATQRDDDGKISVSIKNAPVLGDSLAPVTILEFSDFDCPFCKKAYSDILSQLKKDYIDEGKVKFMYRNAPLPTHPNAKIKAVAALCAKKIGGDEAFYAYHNTLYENTQSTMIIGDFLTAVAQKNSIDLKDFGNCLKNDQALYDQVDLDVADASQVEATGTPTWFIAKTNADGEFIRGIRIVGAQPYSVFRILIKQLLAS